MTFCGITFGVHRTKKLCDRQCLLYVQGVERPKNFFWISILKTGVASPYQSTKDCNNDEKIPHAPAMNRKKSYKQTHQSLDFDECMFPWDFQK